MIHVDADRLSTTPNELVGLMAKLGAYVGGLEAVAERPRPVVLATYGGTRRLPNLTALLALLLRRYGVPVLLHGPADIAREFGRVTTAAVLAELGVAPVKSIAEAQQRIQHEQLAYVPISVLAPGLFELLASQLRAVQHGDPRGLVQLIDPFGGAGFRVVAVSHAGDLQRMRELLAAARADALLLRGTEGEPFANPRHQPRLESFAGGVPALLFEAEQAPPVTPSQLPGALDAAATARWIAAAVEGEQPVPQPIVNQLACCLLGTRRAPGSA